MFSKITKLKWKKEYFRLKFLINLQELLILINLIQTAKNHQILGSSLINQRTARSKTQYQRRD